MSFSFEFPDWITGLFDSGAEAVPAVAGGIEGAGGLGTGFGDFLSALPGAGSFGGFAPEQAFTQLAAPGAETSPIFSLSSTNALAPAGAAGTPFPDSSFIGGEDPYALGGAAKLPATGGLAMSADAGGMPWQDVAPAKSSLFGGVGDFLGEHPTLARSLLPAGAIGLGLARQAMSGQTPGLGAIKDIAGQQTAAARQLQDPLLTGQLPSQFKAAIDSSYEATKAAIRSKHAQMGTSNSSMEMADLNAAEMQKAQAYTQQALSLYSAGAQALGIANQADMEVMKAALLKDQEMTTLLASVAQAGMYGALKS